MQRSIHRAIAGFLAGAVLVAGFATDAYAISPASVTEGGAAQRAASLWDDKGNIKADNQQELADLIAKAKDAGVQVKATDQMLDPVSESGVASAKQNLESLNQKQIDILNAAIASQQTNNDDFTVNIKDELQKMFAKDPGLDISDANIDWECLSVITQAPNTREHPFSLTMHPKAGTPANEQDFNARKYITVGDAWTYSNVFQDAHSGAWVDMNFTLIGAQEHNWRRHTAVPTDTVYLKRGIYTDSVQMETYNYDVNLKVDYTNNATGEPVNVTPLVIFTDVDVDQGVEVTSPTPLQSFAGSAVRHGGSKKEPGRGGDQAIFSDGSNAEPSYRQNWAVYSLPETSSMTYWFYDGSTGQVLHGTGGTGLGFIRPDKQFANADITLYKQAVQHSVDYKVVGDAPEKSSALPVSQVYAHNADVTIAGGLTTESDVKNGIDGTWKFKGWFTDEATTNPASNFAITQDTTLYGGWDFVSNPYKVTHEFVSGTSGVDLPKAIVDRTPADIDGVATGTAVSPGDFDHSDYDDAVNDGTWSFQSWDKDSKTINRADEHFVGTWVFAPNKYKVTHEFKSGTEGMELPKNIADRVPANQADMTNGTVVKPSDFDRSDYADAEHDGTWSFQSWDKDQATIDHADVHFVGTWVFSAKQYKVTHEFKSGTEGKELPQDIVDRVPADQTGVISGTAVKPGVFDHSDYVDAVNDGTWSFQSWDKDQAKVNKADVHFVGTWVFTPNEYKVTHEFVSGTDGMELPKDVSDRVPADQEGKLNKETVAPGEFDQSQVIDDAHDGVWSFQSWDKTEATIEKGDVHFVGKWVFTPHDYAVTYAFVSGTRNMVLPEEIVDRVPAEEDGMHDGDIVEPSICDRSDYVDVAHHGVWSFRSWDHDEVTIDHADAEFIGTWVFTADKEEIVPPTPTPAQNAEKPQTPSQPQLAKTGASSMWAAFAAFAMLAFGAMMLIMRKKD